jgi:hypothetical protein
MDAIYLYNKYGKPVTWEQWVAVREILGRYRRNHPRISTNLTTDYVLTIWKGTDRFIIDRMPLIIPRSRYVHLGS